MTGLGARAAALAAAATLLAGCVPPFAGDETPSGAPAKDPGRQLTQAEVDAALPDLPASAEPVEEEAEDPDDIEPTTSPAECLAVRLDGPTFDALREDKVVSAERSWSSDEPAGAVTTAHVASYSRLVGPEPLDAAGAATGGCSAFTYSGRDASGDFTLHMGAAPRTVDPVGEQTFAVRITVEEVIGGADRRVHIDHLAVRSGHNLILLTRTHWDDDATHADLEQYAREALDNLAT
ncbi:hypothetical protein AB4028_15340 [Janibacter sp. RAF20_2_2]|uniref:hypothetical protein n=1 Tax=unclassified Janibacter TaxID=2649294 RepID=UPI003F93E8DF